MNMNMNLKPILGTIAYTTSMTLAILGVHQCSNARDISAVDRKITSVDSTLKSWNEAMKPMVMEANAKKALLNQKTLDSTAMFVRRHKIDSLEKVVSQLKKISK